MKTYACSRCGNRTEWGWNNESLECGECGGEMHALDGIVSGGGVKAIWRDGREVWSGTAMEAVELLEKYWASIEFAREVESDIRAERTISSREYLAQLQLEKDRCVEADWIVRELADTYGSTDSLLEYLLYLRTDACEYVAKYPKT